MILSMIMAIENEEESSFVEDIYFKHRDRMLAICYKVLKNPADAEDALVNAFENIIRTVQSVQAIPMAKLPAALNTYAYNAAIDLYRRHKVENKLFTSQFYHTDDGDKPFDYLDPSFDLDKIVLDKELIVEIFHMIKNFPPSLRIVAVCKWQYGYRNKEIAEMLQISESIVSTRVSRARSMLFQTLSEKYSNTNN